METFFRGKLNVFVKLSTLFDRGEKIQFLFVLAIALIAALFQTLGVLSVLPFLQLVMNPEMVEENGWLNLVFQELGFQSVFSFTIFMGFVMLGILLAGNAVSAFSSWLKIHFVWQKNHSISHNLLKKYLSLPYAYFLNRHSADLGKNVLSEVERLTSQLLMPLSKLLTSLIVVIMILAVLILVSPAVAVSAVILFGSSYLIIFAFLRARLKTRGERRLEENTGRFTVASEALAGIKDIKILGREGYFLERFSQHSKKFSNLQAWVAVVGQFPRYLMEAVSFGGILVLVLFFLAFEQDSSHIIPLLSFFVFAGYRLMPALQEIFYGASTMQFNEAVLDKIAKDMDGEVRETITLHERPLPPPLAFRDRLVLEDVSFHYPFGRTSVLSRVNLEIPKGSFVGLVGPTGGGKTTLGDILIGLLSPNAGRMMVDGVPIGTGNVRNWQRTLGYVPQQVFLIDDTIVHNVAFGLSDREIDRDRLEEVCKIANLHEFILSDLPQGYDTPIGERGVRLSGGQKQRIGIARALYHDPEFLVLDEATSSLDGITEKAVLQAIENVAKKKTMVAIAHRFATVKNCDILYLIDRGFIVTKGTYEELLEGDAQFRAMARGVE
ncbi:MAG: ABC transporter ATP-binding protein [Candidatus Yanofskybacteria bacterium]|nr:ABC transporter ATP-binding protein [Candidatus Yanofskybacteria bacterium]